MRCLLVICAVRAGGCLCFGGLLCLSEHDRYLWERRRETQASGLPVIVSDVGGPRDLQHGRDGFVTKALDDGSCQLSDASPKTQSCVADGPAFARGRVETRDWSEAFETFWHASP
jgi:hypothetical protein